MALKFSTVAALIWACSGSAGGAAGEHSTGGLEAIVSHGAGGSSAVDASSATGGVDRTGGVASTGGTSALGSSASAIAGTGTALGGTSAAGGSKAAGGNKPSGGSKAAGGSPVLGGSKATGGTVVSGGTTASGGTSAIGGKATGGKTDIGGTSTTSGTAIGGRASGGAAPVGGTSAMGGSSLAGGSRATGGKPSTNTSPGKCSVYLAGDSTVSSYTLTSSTRDQAGWGQMLQQYFDSTYVTVVNKAVGGMTARHFIQAGNLDAILGAIKAGDYFLVQFGTNDSNTSATYTIDGVSYPYFADANTHFKTYLQEYIDGAKAKAATPVLVTPPPRNSAYCNGGRSMGSYAQAMLDLGKAQQVAVIDLSIKAWTYLSGICPKPTDGTSETFFKVNSDNTIDGTHFQENGATMLAGFVADGIAEAGLDLDAYRIK